MCSQGTRRLPFVEAVRCALAQFAGGDAFEALLRDALQPQQQVPRVEVPE